jgi:hypothetical protein
MVKTTEQTGITPSEDSLTWGYMVGVRQSGEFEFRLLTDDTGLIQLLGLHAFAGHKIENIKDLNQGQGDLILQKKILTLAQAQEATTDLLKSLLHILTKELPEQ